MIQDETVKKLISLSVPKTFGSGEYICYEGQPGDEMYIILRGSVGIYIENAVGTQTEAARIMAGDFFGEMAVFDNMPRSASCIALEDVICVALDKSKMVRFFELCPDLTLKLVENMSGRIRRLDYTLYKTDQFVPDSNVSEFKIPSEYSFSHNIEEPSHNLAYAELVNADCPVCGKNITVLNLKRSVMSERKQQLNGRINYKECDPLWYDVWSCPYCHYSNHYLSFFKMLPFKRELIKRVLKEQHKPVLENHAKLTTPFDQLFLRYMEAIHINETVNSKDYLLLGKLWLNLYWLFIDAGDEKMRIYCAEKAAPMLERAVSERAVQNTSDVLRCRLTTANLYAETGNKNLAAKCCEEVINGGDGALKVFALNLKNSLNI